MRSMGAPLPIVIALQSHQDQENTSDGPRDRGVEKQEVFPEKPAIIPSGRRTRTVPTQNDRDSLRMLVSERFVFPLVRYPISPRHRTLLQGQMPAIRPKTKVPRIDGSRVAIILLLFLKR
jgi:hypothetical protein